MYFAIYKLSNYYDIGYKNCKCLTNGNIDLDTRQYNISLNYPMTSMQFMNGIKTSANSVIDVTYDLMYVGRIVQCNC